MYIFKANKRSGAGRGRLCYVCVLCMHVCVHQPETERAYIYICICKQKLAFGYRRVYVQHMHTQHRYIGVMDNVSYG